MISIALIFVPTFLEEIDRIKEAQMARGADFRTGPVIRRAKSVVSLLVPLVLCSFRRADALATAMEATGIQEGSSNLYAGAIYGAGRLCGSSGDGFDDRASIFSKPFLATDTHRLTQTQFESIRLRLTNGRTCNQKPRRIVAILGPSHRASQEYPRHS